MPDGSHDARWRHCRRPARSSARLRSRRAAELWRRARSESAMTTPREQGFRMPPEWARHGALLDGVAEPAGALGRAPRGGARRPVRRSRAGDPAVRAGDDDRAAGARPPSVSLDTAARASRCCRSTYDDGWTRDIRAELRCAAAAAGSPASTGGFTAAGEAGARLCRGRGPGRGDLRAPQDPAFVAALVARRRRACRSTARAPASPARPALARGQSRAQPG